MQQVAGGVQGRVVQGRGEGGRGRGGGRGEGGKGKGTTGGKGKGGGDEPGTPVRTAAPLSAGHLAAERSYREKFHVLKKMVDDRAAQHESDGLDHEQTNQDFWVTLMGVPEGHHERGQWCGSLFPFSFLIYVVVLNLCWKDGPSPACT